MTPGDVRRAEATLLQGIQVGSVFEEQKVFDVIVQGVSATRRSVADIQALLIDRPGGGHIRLGQVADVRTVPSASIIRRDAVSRRMDVVADVQGRSAADVAADIRSQVETLRFPLEYHAEVLQRGTADEMGAGRAVGFGTAAALAAFLLFQSAFASWRLALGMSLALPLALVGGLIAGLFTGLDLSLGAVLGFLALLGYATRTGMTMIASLQSAAGDADTDALVRAAVGERWRPIVASSLALAALALPFVVLGARPGLEILHPLAVVLLGGLISTAFVTLFVLPAMFRHLGRSSPPGPFRDERGERGVTGRPFDRLRARTDRPWRARGRALPGGLLLAAIALAGAACAPVEEEAGSDYEPATMGSADPAGVKAVTFTDDATRRVGLQTVPALAAGRYVVVDYAALIYDKKGLSWVYTVPKPLTYLRTRVDVARVDGSRVTLTRGPKPGTHVVTRGAAEVYGAELGMAKKR